MNRVLGWALAASAIVGNPVRSQDLPVDSIRLPDGFRIALYARVPDARSMALTAGMCSIRIGSIAKRT